VAAPAIQTTQALPQQASGECLQVREYQTEIVVGGKTVPAYGNACLQPDGSWKKVTGPFAAE
jgi:surface antigen